MATASKLTKEERNHIAAALKLMHTSQSRGAKAAASDTIKAAYEAEAAKTVALANRIINGELEL